MNCSPCQHMMAQFDEVHALWESAMDMAQRALELHQSIIDGCPSHGDDVVKLRRCIQPGAEHHALLGLTPREREVLHLVAKGQPNRHIARNLGIAEKTVKNHLYAIFAKLDVGDRTQAALLAVEGLSPA